MNRLVRRLVVLALLTLPSAASAQEPQAVITDAPITYGAGAGVSVPIGDAENALERGFVVHGFARFRLTDTPLIPRVDLEYHNFDLKTEALGNGGSADMIGGAANVQLFLMGGRIRPYAVGGIGLYYIKFKYDATGVSGSTSDSSTRFGLNGGGGVAFRVNPRLSIYGEIRLDNIISDEGPVDSDLQVVPFTFGVTF